MNTVDDFLIRLTELLRRPLFNLGDTPFTLFTLVKFCILLALVLAAERLFRRVVVQRALRRTRLSESMQYAVGRIIGYALLLLGFYIALKLVGIDLSSLAVIAGAVGVGLGFGLQNIVSNFISGLIILAEQPIAIGDRVEVNGIHGQVTRINLRATEIITNDNISVIVPNSNFISEPVVNWSHGDPKVRICVPIGVAYGTDVEKLKNVLLAVAAAHPQVLKDPAPSVFFIGFGDSSLDFELGVWTTESARRPKRFRSDLNFGIEKALRDAQIEIPFPQRDLHIRSGTLSIRRET